MQARLFRLWPEQVVRRIEHAVLETVCDWHADWDGLAGMGAVSCLGSAEAAKAKADDSAWMPLSAGCWYARRDAGGFGSSSNVPEALAGPVEQALQAAAWSALFDDMGKRLSADSSSAAPPEPPPAWVRHAGSGFVVTRLRLNEAEVDFLMNPLAVARFASSTKPALPLPPLATVDLRQVASSSLCSLQVVLGEVEVDLANLATLGIGDVLRLGQRIEVPLPVRYVESPNGDAHDICRAALGQRGGRLSAKLLRPFPSPSSH